MKKLLLILLLSISYNLSAQVINPTTGKIWMENSLPGHYQWGHVSNFFEIYQNPSNYQSGYTYRNPCPSGWRLPTVAEMIQEMNSWQSLTADGATNSPLKWELNGYRYYRNGEVYIDSIFGAYWTAESYSQQSAYYLYIYGDVADIGVYYKANGQSIRCIMD